MTVNAPITVASDIIAVDPADAATEPFLYATFDDGADLVVAGFDDAGAYIEDIGSPISGLNPNRVGHRILTVASGAANPGSVIVGSANGTPHADIKVYDPVSGTTYSIGPINAGWDIFTNNPAMVGSDLYWVEADAARDTLRLMRAKCDGTSSSQVSEVDISTATGSMSDGGTGGVLVFDGTSWLYGVDMISGSDLAVEFGSGYTTIAGSLAIGGFLFPRLDGAGWCKGVDLDPDTFVNTSTLMWNTGDLDYFNRSAMWDGAAMGIDEGSLDQDEPFSVNASGDGCLYEHNNGGQVTVAPTTGGTSSASTQFNLASHPTLGSAYTVWLV